jgi:4-amino-4-deoxy-L-arabinose transferase-like glycosyltransferase
MQAIRKTPVVSLILVFAIAVGALLLAIAYVHWVEPRDVAAEETQKHTSANVTLKIPGRALVDDEVHYLGIAKNIANGNGYALTEGTPTAVRVPLYPYYLAFLFKAFGESVGIALLGNAFLVSVLPLLAFALTRPIFGSEAAILAAAICALDPGIYFLGVGRAYSEPLFAVCFCAATLLWVKAREFGDSAGVLPGRGLRQVRIVGLDRRLVIWSGLSGLLYGAASLTRTGYLALPLAILLGEMILRSGKTLIKSAALVLLASLLVVFPWALRNRVVLGKTVISSTNDGVTLLGTVLAEEQRRGDWLNPEEVSSQFARLQRMPDGVARNAALEKVAFREQRNVPASAMLVTVAKRVVRLWVPLNRIVDDEVSEKANLAANVLYFPFMLLALFGLRKSPFKKAVPLLVPCGYATLLAAVSWGGTRFRYGLEPILACFAGYGLIELGKQLGLFESPHARD